MGVRLSEPGLVEVQDDRAGSYVRVLQQLSGVQVALVVLPNNRKDRYDMIKKQAYVHLGLQTQVLPSRTIGNRRNVRSVATKVAIQLKWAAMSNFLLPRLPKPRCKLGGQVRCLEIPLARSMVIGYDTYHDSSQCRRLAGALVAGPNNTFNRWFSRVSFQSSHQELGNALALQLRDALQRYASENGGAGPERILMQVRHTEINQIVASLDFLLPGQEPKLAFEGFNNSGRYANPPPDTVVDSEVTRPERYDFFLVSQSVSQGTVAPTHYSVIYDTTGLRPDHVQRLSYKLTHLYFDWPGTIPVPAPCQYAHKLAFLADQSLLAEPHAQLPDTLFYL